MATENVLGPLRAYIPGLITPSTLSANEPAGTLTASALFSGLSRRECADILSTSRGRSFNRDQTLFAQGQPVRSFVVLESGCVKHTQLSPRGNEVLMRMSSAGDALNIQASSADGTYTCSARAVENCYVRVWDNANLAHLLDRYPQVRRNMSQIIDGHLREMEERFRELATERVARRLALALVRLMKKVGKPVEGGTQVSLSREELAQMTGTTLFTISRVLSKWSEAGLVIPRREAVIVCSAARLESASDIED